MHENTDFTDRLWSYIQGEGDAELEAHLLTCADCRDEMEILSGLYAARNIGEFRALPDILTNTLTELFPKVRPDLVQQSEKSPSIPTRVKTIIAELLQDTSLQPQIVGLRGEIRTRQIAFTSDVADLDLEITAARESFLVVGQLGIDEIPDGLNIRFVPAEADPLETSSARTITSEISDEGYFRIDIAPGDWVVAVDIHDAVVLFRGIQL